MQTPGICDEVFFPFLLRPHSLRPSLFRNCQFSRHIQDLLRFDWIFYAGVDFEMGDFGFEPTVDEFEIGKDMSSFDLFLFFSPR